MNKRRVVVTGLGVVAPNGIGKEEFWRANVEGKSGISHVNDFDVGRYGSKVYGKVNGFDCSLKLPSEIYKRVDRFVHLGLIAAKMAIEDSGLNLKAEDRSRIGVIYGSGLGGVLFHEEQMLKGYEKGTHRLNPLCVPRITPNAVGAHIAIYFNILGPNLVISNACASGNGAIGEAFRKIQHGEIDVAISGGAEAPLTEFTFGAYDALGVLAKNFDPSQASCPFDRRRDGFVLAEGSAGLLLEDLDHALSRNANIYAEIVGYALNSGAYNMVIPKPDAEDVCRAMTAALRDAGIGPESIDYINAHGTSTVHNDRVETKAIKILFGDYAKKIPISSTKSMIGHSIGAAGAIEAVVGCLAIHEQFIPPTVNYQEKDSECDLDWVQGQGRSAKLNNVLSNSFGFGSNNACVVLRKYCG